MIIIAQNDLVRLRPQNKKFQLHNFNLFDAVAIYSAIEKAN